MVKKPRGLGIITFLFLLSGLFSIIGFFGNFMFMDLRSVFSLIIGISILILAYGLVKDKIWAWYGTLFVSIIYVTCLKKRRGEWNNDYVDFVW